MFSTVLETINIGCIRQIEPNSHVETEYGSICSVISSPSRGRLPSSTPGGMVMVIVFDFRCTPFPSQVPQYLSTTWPVPPHLCRKQRSDGEIICGLSSETCGAPAGAGWLLCAVFCIYI